MTWDEDDPERNRVTRRTLTKKEMEDGDFHAFIASGSESDVESKTPSKAMGRDKLRELLLGGGGDALPEGWGNSGFDARGDGDDDDVDMEVTFMPALSEKKDEEETTLEKYQRKMREKRKKRKEEGKEGQAERPGSPEAANKGARKGKSAPEDDFFRDSGSEAEAEQVLAKSKGKDGKGKKSRRVEEAEEAQERRPSTKEELSLVVTPDAIANEPKHFDMKAVLRAEKGKKKKKSKRGKKGGDEDDGERELQEDFSIDVKDDRFAAVHEDYTFAIDPSNPQCVFILLSLDVPNVVYVASRRPSRWLRYSTNGKNGRRRNAGTATMMRRRRQKEETGIRVFKASSKASRERTYRLRVVSGSGAEHERLVQLLYSRSTAYLYAILVQRRSSDLHMRAREAKCKQLVSLSLI